MCGNTLFEVTAQARAVFFVIFDDGSGNTVHQIGWLTCSIRLKPGADAHRVGHVHGFSGGHNRCQCIH